MSNLNIYFDLDGTLIDVSERFYRIYSDLLKKFNCPAKLNKEIYWQMKKERITEDKIIEKTCSQINIKEYTKLRQKLIESSEYLNYDIPFPYTLEAVKQLHKNNRLVIVSLRDSLEKTEMELSKFGLRHFFDKILVHNTEIDSKLNIKVDLIRFDGRFNIEDSIVVGDTEADYLAAKELNIPCFLVSSGIRTKEYLAGLNHGFVIKDISELIRK